MIFNCAFFYILTPNPRLPGLTFLVHCSLQSFQNQKGVEGLEVQQCLPQD